MGIFRNIDAMRVIPDHLDESPSPHLRGLLSQDISSGTMTQLNQGLSGEPSPYPYPLTFRSVTYRRPHYSGGPYTLAENPILPLYVDASVPAWPPESPKILRGWWQRYREYKYSLSCCTTRNDPNDLRAEMSDTKADEDAFRYDDEIYAFLYDHTHELLHFAGIEGGILSIVNARIIWAMTAPASANLSQKYKILMGHSTAVTQDHLALIRERGYIDHIHVNFQYDFIRPSIARSISRLLKKLSKR
ncbi:hypothetical protein F4777DRAFT_578550 [Nemania sp. FL0916]|nr:hypothetical protein F4777DRAFT_578550 [Nemania sp. FL0916]